MVRIAVTGASGKAGRGVVHDLLAHGYEVLAIDQVASPDRDVRVLQTDLTDPRAAPEGASLGVGGVAVEASRRCR